MRWLRCLIVALLCVAAPLVAASSQAVAAQFISPIKTESILLKAFWQSRDSNYNIAISGGAYQGPGNLSLGTWGAFWSCRAFSAATAGTKAYRIINETTTLQTDINSLSNGFCDTTTPVTFCTGAVCKIVTYYDQTGGTNCSGSACDITQGTDSGRPTWQASTLNSWPCANVATAGSTVGLTTANNFTGGASQPVTLVALSERTGAFTTAQRIITNLLSGPPMIFNYRGLANGISINAGGTQVNATASDSAFHVTIARLQGASSALWVDAGTPSTGSIGTNAFSSSDIYVMNDNSVANSLQGNFCEGGIMLAAIATGNVPTLNTNIHSATYGWDF